MAVRQPHLEVVIYAAVDKTVNATVERNRTEKKEDVIIACSFENGDDPSLISLSVYRAREAGWEKTNASQHLSFMCPESLQGCHCKPWQKSQTPTKDLIYNIEANRLNWM